MASRLTFDKACWYENQDGFWMAVRTRERAAAAAFCSGMKEAPYIAELKERKKKRSLDANAYLWVLLDKLSVAMRTPKVELYRHFIPDVGGVSETICVQDAAVDRLCDGWEHNGLGWLTERIPSKIEGCTNVILYYGSSTYDTRQMTRLLDLVIAECKEQGVETLTPEELARMEGYDGQHPTG